MVDRLICLSSPAFFHSVGQFYERFTQVDDSKVISLLKRFSSGEEN